MENIAFCFKCCDMLKIQIDVCVCVVLGGTNNFAPRYVPCKSTAVLSSTVVTIAQ